MSLPFDPQANIQSIKVWVSTQNRSVRDGDRNISAHVRSGNPGISPAEDNKAYDYMHFASCVCII